MKFELTILGSGSAVPTLRRNPSAHFLNIQNEYYLIDCAEGTQMQMRRYNVPFQHIDQIFISHLHGDHCLGLPGLLQTKHMLGRTKLLQIFGPKELQELIETHLRLSKTTLRYPIEFVVVDDQQSLKIFENAKLEVWSIPLKHKIDTRGYLFREKLKLRNIKPSALQQYQIPVYWRQKLKEGLDYTTDEGETIKNSLLTTAPPLPRAYAYCSDTAYHEDIIPVITGVDLLYHEASFLEKMKKRALETQHSTAADAANIALKAGVKKLLMGHFSARYLNVEPFLEEAKAIFENCQAAEDGLIIAL